MFITAACVLFLIKLRWPRNKSLYHGGYLWGILCGRGGLGRAAMPLIQSRSHSLQAFLSTVGRLGTFWGNGISLNIFGIFWLVVVHHPRVSCGDQRMTKSRRLPLIQLIPLVHPHQPRGPGRGRGGGGRAVMLLEWNVWCHHNGMWACLVNLTWKCHHAPNCHL